MIEEYSPNICWGKQTVEITLKQWRYAATFKVEIGGNCRGFEVLETAIGTLFEGLYDPSNPTDVARVVLKDSNGDTLLCSDDEDEGEAWLKPMVVSVAIVGWTPPTLNEVRARNGAPPIADGDEPWKAL